MSGFLTRTFWEEEKKKEEGKRKKRVPVFFYTKA